MIKTVRAHQPWSKVYFFSTITQHFSLFFIFLSTTSQMIVYVLKAPFPFLSLSSRFFFPPFPQTESLFTGNVWWALLPGRVDLPQDYLLAFLAAKRPTASDEVARGRPAPYEIRRRTFFKVYWPGARKKSKVRNLASSLMSILFSSTSLDLFCKQCLFLMLMRK